MTKSVMFETLTYFGSFFGTADVFEAFTINRLYYTLEFEWSRMETFDAINRHICYKMFGVHIIDSCVEFLLTNKRCVDHNHCCWWLKISCNFNVLIYVQNIQNIYIKGESNIRNVFRASIFENSARKTANICYISTFEIN